VRPSGGTALTSAGGGLHLSLGGDWQADLGVAFRHKKRETRRASSRTASRPFSSWACDLGIGEQLASRRKALIQSIRTVLFSAARKLLNRARLRSHLAFALAFPPRRQNSLIHFGTRSTEAAPRSTWR